MPAHGSTAHDLPVCSHVCPSVLNGEQKAQNVPRVNKMKTNSHSPRWEAQGWLSHVHGLIFPPSDSEKWGIFSPAHSATVTCSRDKPSVKVTQLPRN